MNWLIIQALDTPLIYACRTGRSGIIAMLINNGANPNATNRVRITELLVFTIILLLYHHLTILQRGLTPLMYAVESCSVEAVKNLLNGGAQTCLVEPVKLISLYIVAKIDEVMPNS